MKFLIPLPLLMLLVVGYPYGVNKTIITANDYPDRLVIYEGNHDIIDIMVPLNALNEHNYVRSQTFNDNRHHILFFVEGDVKHNHPKEYGIYMYLHGKVTKIMDKGRAIAASIDDSEHVFFGAKDGLYVYNPQTLKAETYGNFNNSIKSMAKEQYTDVIYILTDNGELYKVYDAGMRKTKLKDIKDAEQIMIDYSNNLYYYGKNKKLYVRRADGEIRKIKGLPNEAIEIKLLRPLLFNNEEIGVIIDNNIYTVFSDGTSQPENVQFMPGAQPTAFSMEAGIFHYFGYKNKIYEYELSLMKDYKFNGYEFNSESESDEA